MGCGSPPFGNELRLRNPQTGRLDGDYLTVDFAKNAESLGAVAFRANSEAELREALERAKHETRTVVIHVPVRKDARVPNFEGWWDVPVAAVSGEASVQQARAAYEQAHAAQRFYY
jgi:3D-(3,5/4)-trihydroxycyclohexane-1,2-dione acylhydrolase (decyclizing)